MENNEQATGKVKIPLKQALGMILPYARNKIVEQIKSVALIVLYLILFQTIVLSVPITPALVIALGMGLVVIGLAFFMEGLFLGLMPLGESCGLKLPQKSKLPVILIFSFILGIGATMAEPAIGVLKAAGSSVKAWDAPLLFFLLNKHSDYLVYAVGIGVGLAVLCGMLRFLYKWSLKPFLYIFVVALTGLSAYAYFEPNLVFLTGLAWDCGGVTTGPVTVPLVLALGIGITRIVGGKDSGTGGGFGVVTMASAFPVLTVLLLGMIFMNYVPKPMSEQEFLRLENRSRVSVLFNNDDEFLGYALKHTDSALAVFDGSTQAMSEFLRSIKDDEEKKKTIFGDDLSYKRFIFTKGTTEDKIAVLGENWEFQQMDFDNAKKNNLNMTDIFKRNFFSSLQAIIPLSLFLIFVLLVILRDKISTFDETILGLAFAIFGMTLFSLGIELGLSKLGNQVGTKLPSSFKAITLHEQKQILSNVDESMIYKAVDENGKSIPFFYTKIENKYKPLIFEEKNYNAETEQYIYTPQKGPIFGNEKSFLGYLVVMIFAFIMGYGATLAEPALNALGLTVEELSIGTFKKSLLMQSVAIGVGIGIAIGVAKIIWNIPLIWLLAPPYLVLILITYLSSEDFVNIGWDSAGVTTGPITVPLVLAMGLGVGGEVGAVEGFGILALASVYPILSVLAVGLYVNRKRCLAIQDITEI